LPKQPREHIDQDIEQWAAKRGSAKADRVIREAATAPAKCDGAYRGRRISRDAFYKEFPHLRPANDNKKPGADRQAG